MIESAVLSTTGTTLDHLLTDRQGNVARELALFLATELTDATNGQISDWLCTSTVAPAIRRSKGRVRDPAFATLLSLVRGELRWQVVRSAAS